MTMKVLLAVLVSMFLAGDEPTEAQPEWLEVERRDYDGSKDSRISYGGFSLGGLIIDRLEGETVAVFLARPLDRFDQHKDLQVVFLDEQGKRHVAEARSFSGSRVSDQRVGAILYASPADCPPESIRTVVFEQMSTEELRVRLAAEKRARSEFRAKVAKAATRCPLPGPVIGQPYPFKLTDLNGNEISTEKWRGKVIVLEFWATWCGPCLVEIPELKELYDRHHHQGLEVLGISLDRQDEAVSQFIKKNGIPWPQFLVGDDVQRAALGNVTGVRGIPRYFVIDRAGKLRTDHGRGLLGEIVPELLRKSD